MVKNKIDTGMVRHESSPSKLPSLLSQVSRAGGARLYVPTTDRKTLPLQSEYLSGFVDGDDRFGEYAGYGALDSGGEEEDGEDGEAEEGGCVDASADGEAGEVCHGNGAAATTAAIAIAGEEEERSEERGGGCAEGGDGGVVDPAHIEVSFEHAMLAACWLRGMDGSGCFHICCCCLLYGLVQHPPPTKAGGGLHGLANTI